LWQAGAQSINISWLEEPLTSLEPWWARVWGEQHEMFCLCNLSLLKGLNQLAIYADVTLFGENFSWRPIKKLV